MVYLPDKEYYETKVNLLKHPYLRDCNRFEYSLNIKKTDILDYKSLTISALTALILFPSTRMF